MEQFLTKLDEPGRVRVALEHLEVEISAWTDREDHVDWLPFTGGDDHRGAPDRCPGGSRVVIRADPRLISEEDPRTHLCGLRVDRRVGLLLPLPDPVRILLIRPVQRALR